MLGGDAAGGGDPVHGRHAQVHQHHVGAFPGDHGDRFGAGRRLPHDLELGLPGEHAAQPVPDDRVVIGDHQPDAHGATPFS
jgi:hypothetical protein